MPGRERIEVDAAEDVGHRDQHDRGVDRREQHRRASCSRARPTCSGRRRQPDRCSTSEIDRHTVQFTCMTSGRCADDRRHAGTGERAPDRARPARAPAPGREHASDLAGRGARAGSSATGPQTTSALAAAERVRPQSMAQTIAELEAAGLVARRPRPGRPAPDPDRADRARARHARRRPPAPRGLARPRRSRRSSRPRSRTCSSGRAAPSPPRAELTAGDTRHASPRRRDGRAPCGGQSS